METCYATKREICVRNFLLGVILDNPC
uniref:Uncharacterized protein n=1 Tax=Arundo donax TaxID=35708 RepID=A0A0A9EM38_ARUDO